jgi:eukaryotic-like serine/threonine-protein kinase
MGEVYRAHDSRLNREVAIKVSVEQFSDRFEREARAVAALRRRARRQELPDHRPP